MGKFKHRFTLPAIIAALIAVCLSLCFGWHNFHQGTTLPSDSNLAAIGVQLNQDEDYVDLHQLQANGISFVYLKSTQGRSYFDDNYLSYRDQVQGTKLAFGSILTYSDESTPDEQYRYFKRMVGQNTGSLPVLISPAVPSRKLGTIKNMAVLAGYFLAAKKRVIVEAGNQYRKYFPLGTQFMSAGSQLPSRVQYSFWQYTDRGRVRGVSGLDRDVTMYAYNGTISQYKSRYGQLTQ